MRRLFSLVLFLLPVAVLAQPADSLPPTNYFELSTPRGRIVVRLFDETPLHRDNFKRLTVRGVYDSTYFHRIIDGFVVQGGDPNTKDTVRVNDGEGDAGYTVPAEIGRPHLRGALAAARQGDDTNPNRESSGSQFYLVVGAPGPRLLDPYLDRMRDERIRPALGDTAWNWSDSVRARYRALGGVPFLDGQYTVFGEMVEGDTVLTALARADTPRQHPERLHDGLPVDQNPWADRPFERLFLFVRPLYGYTPPPQP